MLSAPSEQLTNGVFNNAKQLQLAAPDAMRPKRYLDTLRYRDGHCNKRALAAGLRLGADGSLEEMRLKGPPHDLAAAQ